MVDLVARRRRRSSGNGADDPFVRERVEHVLEPLGRLPGVAAEIADAVGDLRPRRGHELVEQPRDELPVGLVERRKRPLEVLLDDPPGAAELGERLGAEHRRAAPRSTSQSRSITSWRYGASTRPRAAPPATIRGPQAAARSAPTRPGRRRPRRAPPRLPSCGAAERLELGERLDDRGARGVDVEVVEPEHVAEQPGTRPLNASSSASASSRMPSRTWTRSVGRARISRAPPGAGRRIAPVVDEVLLHLVEHEVDLASDLCRPLREDVGELRAATRAWRAPAAAAIAAQRVVAPLVDDDRQRAVSVAAAAAAGRAPAAAARPRPAAASSCRRRSARRARSAARRPDSRRRARSRGRDRRRTARRARSRRSGRGPCTGRPGARAAVHTAASRAASSAVTRASCSE